MACVLLDHWIWHKLHVTHGDYGIPRHEPVNDPYCIFLILLTLLTRSIP
jgi:hypothetical protein